MDTIVELRESYEKVKNLLEEECKKDPETEPYKSKYKAVDHLKCMKELIMTVLEKPDTSDQLKGMLGVVLLQLGSTSLDVDELSTGESYLNEALKAIPNEHDSKFILIALTARNLLGILWSQRGEIEQSQKWLEGSEKLYVDYSSSNCFEDTLSLHDHFFESNYEPVPCNGCEELEKAHTLTKFYLAQVYGKLGDPMKSATYCHETLRRQLESKQYDAIDWALNAATLSQFFMEQRLYRKALHHLAAASFILDQHEEAIKTMDISEEEVEAKKEELKHRGADVSRCWAKYGIYILEQSGIAITGEDVQVEDDARAPLPQDMSFTTLELSEYEGQMPDDLVRDFDAARDVMLVTQRYIIAAKQYYTLEDHASDYVQIIQDHSTLLRHLSRFEKDHGRLCKMLKKRINMLEDVLKEINPQYYLNVCRSLWFEVGESYHDLMQLKQDRIKETGDLPNPAALAKANHLAERSILNFHHFLESIKSKQSHELPENLPDDLLRPVLVAHFFLGRLYHKLLTPDKRQSLKNSSDALNCFKYLDDYCKNHPKAALVISDELSISQEMMSLLDLKIRHMANVIS